MAQEHKKISMRSIAAVCAAILCSLPCHYAASGDEIAEESGPQLRFDMNHDGILCVAEGTDSTKCSVGPHTDPPKCTKLVSPCPSNAHFGEAPMILTSNESNCDGRPCEWAIVFKEALEEAPNRTDDSGPHWTIAIKSASTASIDWNVDSNQWTPNAVVTIPDETEQSDNTWEHSFSYLGEISHEGPENPFLESCWVEVPCEEGD